MSPYSNPVNYPNNVLLQHFSPSSTAWNPGSDYILLVVSSDSFCLEQFQSPSFTTLTYFCRGQLFYKMFHNLGFSDVLHE